ncbi:MAG TPA: hypothetical protein VE553_07170, partial [Candidatus Binatia bacterium]|nr:hypothetical protein [Candidatus Binatia bacterium]
MRDWPEPALCCMFALLLLSACQANSPAQLTENQAGDDATQETAEPTVTEAPPTAPPATATAVPPTPVSATATPAFSGVLDYTVAY